MCKTLIFINSLKFEGHLKFILDYIEVILGQIKVILMLNRDIIQANECEIDVIEEL